MLLIVRCDRPGRVSGATGLASPGPGASDDNEETMTTRGGEGAGNYQGLVTRVEIYTGCSILIVQKFLLIAPKI